ncbi:MAG: ribosomal protein S18-alanine N-acetyltransferase [Dehalococcoidia bacterium]
MQTATQVSVRKMLLSDIAQVMQIERDSFPATWPQTAYQRELTKNRLALYFVASLDGAPPQEEPERRGWLRHLLPVAGKPAGEPIAGFIGLWKMVDEAHIVTFAVRPELRREGIGSVLLEHAFRCAEELDLPALTLEVRISNTDAQALYEKWGFQKLGVRKRYYSDNKEDAAIMTTQPLFNPAQQALLEARRRELRGRGLLG